MPLLSTRYLNCDDIPALLELEHSKWELNQVACAQTLRQRIETYPQLCIGTFCPLSGKALASLFMRPVTPGIFLAPTRWEVTADVVTAAFPHEGSRSLFGISLSSNSADAVKAIFRFFYPRALKAGYRDVYLGSPIPGFRKAYNKNPAISVWEYVQRKKKFQPDEPQDPQLNYYFKKGFKHIVSVQKDYFPHEESLDYGVVLRCIIPFSRPAPLWKWAPISLLRPVTAMMMNLSPSQF